MMEAVRFSEASVGLPSDKLRTAAQKKALMSISLNSHKSLKCHLLPFIATAYLFSRHTVTQLVETLRYKPEGHGFHFRWCHWNFSLT